MDYEVVLNIFPRQIWHNQCKAEYREDTALKAFLLIRYYEVYLKLTVWRQLSYIDLRHERPI